MGHRFARVVVVALVAAPLLAGCNPLKRRAYESSDRNEWQQPERVVEALGLRPGDRVADIGSGSGYFTLRLARAVGPGGRVYAADVDADMNEYLRERLADEGIGNVEVIDAEFGDPLLPDAKIDLAFTSNTYHHMQERPAYFRALRADLAPGGRVAIVDYDGRKGWFVRLVGHFVEKEVLLREMEEAGYRVAADPGFLDRQSFVVFAPE